MQVYVLFHVQPMMAQSITFPVRALALHERLTEPLDLARLGMWAWLLPVLPRCFFELPSA
jgi:hypothetical protein